MRRGSWFAEMNSVIDSTLKLSDKSARLSSNDLNTTTLSDLTSLASKTACSDVIPNLTSSFADATSRKAFAPSDS